MAQKKRQRAEGGGRKPSSDGPVDVQINTRITKETMASLRKIAADQGIGVSEIVRRAIEHEIDVTENPPPKHLTDLSQAVTSLAFRVEKSTGKRWCFDENSVEGLLAGLRLLLKYLVAGKHVDAGEIVKGASVDFPPEIQERYYGTSQAAAENEAALLILLHERDPPPKRSMFLAGDPARGLLGIKRTIDVTGTRKKERAK